MDTLLAIGLFASLVVLVAVTLARGIDRAAVDEGQLPAPLPLALLYVKQRRARKLHPWWRRA